MGGRDLVEEEVAGRDEHHAVGEPRRTVTSELAPKSASALSPVHSPYTLPSLSLHPPYTLPTILLLLLLTLQSSVE